MSDESKPIPKLAVTACQMAQLSFQDVMNSLASEVLEAMGLSPADGWVVDFAQGLAIKQATQ